jgi:cysteine synthase A
VKNTDVILAIDDAAVVKLARLFNEPAGKTFLIKQGVAEDFVDGLDLLGFSGISNLLSSIKFAKYFELDSQDVVLTVLTDSMELYASRLREMKNEFGTYSDNDAAADYARYLKGVTTDHLLDTTYVDRRRVHNLKYFTWIEQQAKEVEKLKSQWYDREYWLRIQSQVTEIDQLIESFNQEVGLI